MSERIEGAMRVNVGRACGLTAFAVGTVVNVLHGTPILALKAGGLLSLMATFVLLLGARVEGIRFSKIRIWRALEGHERPAVDRAQAVIGGAWRRALRIHAFWFAVAAAACLAIALAGEVNLILYPPP